MFDKKELEKEARKLDKELLDIANDFVNHMRDGLSEVYKKMYEEKLAKRNAVERKIKICEIHEELGDVLSKISTIDKDIEMNSPEVDMIFYSQLKEKEKVLLMRIETLSGDDNKDDNTEN